MRTWYFRTICYIGVCFLWSCQNLTDWIITIRSFLSSLLPPSFSSSLPPFLRSFLLPFIRSFTPSSIPSILLSAIHCTYYFDVQILFPHPNVTILEYSMEIPSHLTLPCVQRSGVTGTVENDARANTKRVAEEATWPYTIQPITKDNIRRVACHGVSRRACEHCSAHALPH